MSQISLSGTHNIQNKEELSALAARISKELKAGDVVLLSGDLGAGKTTFTQFLGKSMGVQDVITSPTYTLVGEYGTTNNPNISTLIHIDLYRTGDVSTPQPSALSDTYIQEIVDGAEGNKAIVVIEWGEMLKNTPKKEYWNISIEVGDNSERRIVSVDKSQV